jgi:hypothetical protein
MGQVLHGCARTTAAVRRAIQSSQESLIARGTLRHRPQDGSELEEAFLGGGCSHRAGDSLRD